MDNWKEEKEKYKEEKQKQEIGYDHDDRLRDWRDDLKEKKKIELLLQHGKWSAKQATHIHKCVGSRGAVVSAALSERKVAGSIPTIGDFLTVGPCKKAVFACLTTDAKWDDTFTFTRTMCGQSRKCIHITHWNLKGIFKAKIVLMLRKRKLWWEEMLGNRKQIVREVARAHDKHYLRESADRKAQISKVLVQLSGLICALRSADFLRHNVYHPKEPRAHAQSLFLIPIVFGIYMIHFFFFFMGRTI